MRRHFIPIIAMWLAGMATAATATELRSTRAPDAITGSWRVVEALGAPGVYTGESDTLAKDAVGLDIRIADHAVTMGDDIRCTITDVAPAMLDNTGFGSAGGNWGRLGLEQLAPDDYRYRVTDIALDCRGGGGDMKRRELLVGNDGDLLLLSFKETYARLERTSEAHGS